jgi:hypothetical protein
MLNHAVEVSKHISRSNPQGPNTLRCEPTIPSLVMCGGEIMALTVDLDAKPCLMTIEIQHIGASGMLLAEAQARLLRPQLSP